MSQTKTLTPAVIYVRMSSSKQEASPDQQRSEVKKLAKQHGCKIIREYFDEAISGDATEKRKAFQQIIRDAETLADFRVILCWDQDRFGRFDSIEAGYWIKPLRDRGVRLITVAQGEIDWNDFAGRMMYSIQQEGKHQYLVDLSRNVLRGRINSAKRGVNQQCPCYGYDRAYYDDKGELAKRVPFGENFSAPQGWRGALAISQDEHAVKTVRWIFETYAFTDCGVYWITCKLNSRKIPSPGNSTWNHQVVRRMLRNPTYTGTLVYGKRRNGKYHQIGDDGEIVQATTPRVGEFADAAIVVEDNHEPLIDRELFERVQTKIQSRTKDNRCPRESKYLLTGVLRCGHCGGPMHGKGRSGMRKNQPTYYKCANATNGLCAGYQVSQKHIEKYVLEFIEERLTTPEVGKAIKEAIHQQAASMDGPTADVRALKARLTAVETKITKGTENLLLASPEDMPEVSAMLARWRQQRGKLQAELEAAAALAAGWSHGELADRAVAEYEKLRQHLCGGAPLEVREVIRCLIDSITLWWSTQNVYRQVVRGEIAVSQKGSRIAAPTAEGQHPLADHREADGTIPSPWARRGWPVYLDHDAAVRRAIAYVEQNPVREGKPLQRWSFVVPYSV